MCEGGVCVCMCAFDVAPLVLVHVGEGVYLGALDTFREEALGFLVGVSLWIYGRVCVCVCGRAHYKPEEFRAEGSSQSGFSPKA